MPIQLGLSVDNPQGLGGYLLTLATLNPFFIGVKKMSRSNSRTSVTKCVRQNLSQAQKRKILEEYNYECQYCYGPGDVVDHIIPLSYSLDNSESNLVCSCWMCNAIANDKVFRSFGQKRNYIIDRRHSYIKKHPIPLWTRNELKELGYVLRTKIRKEAIICDNEDHRRHIADKLLEEGWRVVTGRWGKVPVIVPEQKDTPLSDEKIAFGRNGAWNPEKKTNLLRIILVLLGTDKPVSIKEIGNIVGISTYKVRTIFDSSGLLCKKYDGDHRWGIKNEYLDVAKRLVGRE